MNDDLLLELLKALEKGLKLPLKPVLNLEFDFKEPALIYEIIHEESELSLDNKIISQSLEIDFMLLAQTYKDLRALKNKFLSLVFSLTKKPASLDSGNESLDSENKLYSLLISLKFVY